LKSKSTGRYRKSKRDEEGVLKWQCSQCKEFKYEQDYHKDNFNRVIRSVCKTCYKQRHPIRTKKQ
jgi:hypothetical protein